MGGRPVAPEPADDGDAAQEVFEDVTVWARIREMFASDRKAMFGAVVIVLFIVIALAAPLISPHDPYKVDLRGRLAGMTSEHVFGTDSYGRDMLTRIFYGARVSLLIGLVPSLIAIVIGATLGLISGYFGGRIDFLIMRLADIVLSFPSILLAMVIMYTLGASLMNLFIALSVINWGVTARTVRAQTLSLREKEFVEAARSVGVSPWVIMFKHILPNCIPTLLVILTLDIPDAVLSESTLSFLGVGAQPPEASWGLMISENKKFLFTQPWVALAPGVAILLLVISFNFLGDGLRDALDPFMRDT